MKRVMWIERKGEQRGGIVGPARIGWVKVKDGGKRIDYQGRTFSDSARIRLQGKFL